MNNDFYLKDTKDFLNKTVLVKGWIYNKRSSGGIVFLQIRDGTGFIQATVSKNEVSESVFASAQEATLETSVYIAGVVKEEKRAPEGYEICVKNLEIISKAEEYPIGKKEHGPDFLLNHRHLWLRSKRQWAIQRIRNEIIYTIYHHLAKEGFVKIDAPIFTPNACEGTTTLFPVPYLPAWKDTKKVDYTKTNLIQSSSSNKPYVFLSQSGQLYLEAAIFSHRKVFDFGPTFRAEKSKTRRHLTEFWMMDAEMAFADHIENMNCQEKLITAIVEAVLKKCRNELEIIERPLEPLKKILNGNFPRITHKQAVALLKKAKFSISERDDFGADMETWLAKEFSLHLFIEKYPKEVKAFYMKEDPDDASRVLNNDLLAPEGYGEIIGGSQREEDLVKLQSRIKELNYSEKDYQWYLDLRRYGSVLHSGYGLGLERVVAWICKLPHLRETIPFPRMMERFNP